MKNSRICPRCSENRVYSIRREKLRCARCRYEWSPKKLPLRLTHEEWKSILRWFLHGLSGQAISEETGINRQRIHRALLVLRHAMASDIPEVFSGKVEVDETYVGGQWKNKRNQARKISTKRGRGTRKTPVFGILCRGGNVWANVVPDVETKTLIPLITKRVKRGSTVFSDTWKSYTGIAAKGYVHRLVEHGKGEYVSRHGNHINSLEGFWGYLKRKLASKGGIRSERLPPYLAEYKWRYNHRHFQYHQKVTKLLNLLLRFQFSGG